MAIVCAGTVKEKTAEERKGFFIRAGPDIRKFLTTSSLLAALAVAAVLLLPQAAQAQLPAICDQYPDLPQCEEGGGGGGGGDENPSGDEGPGGGSGNLPSGEADAGAQGDLPFTGYPMTAILLLMLALLVMGLIIRSVVAIRDRRSAGSSQPPS